MSKTRSISGLAQFVCQIITTLKLEDQFQCQGVQDLAAFKAIMEEVNGIDLGHGMFGDSGELIIRLPQFVRGLDALLQLLDSTADALAAEWGLRSDAAEIESQWNDGGDFEPTIQ